MLKLAEITAGLTSKNALFIPYSAELVLWKGLEDTIALQLEHVSPHGKIRGLLSQGYISGFSTLITICLSPIGRVNSPNENFWRHPCYSETGFAKYFFFSSFFSSFRLSSISLFRLHVASTGNVANNSISWGKFAM